MRRVTGGHPAGGGEHSKPRYRKPPVVEVVLSVAFEALQGFKVVHFGELWRQHFSELTEVEEQSPIEMAVERFNGGLPTIAFRMTPDLPLPRVWFQNKARTQLVQIQNNFLARNWRKGETADDYPRYPALRESFVRDLTSIGQFLAKQGMDPMTPTQCEITYINHVRVSAVEEVLSFVSRPRSQQFRRPEATNVATQFLLAQATDQVPVGRVYLQAVPARLQATGDPIVVLTITARGAPIGAGAQGVLSFLDLGRKACREVFDTMTRTALRKTWEGQ
jgi:uncharacterized protein (TIGR04255 family)